MSKEPNPIIASKKSTLALYLLLAILNLIAFFYLSGKNKELRRSFQLIDLQRTTVEVSNNIDRRIDALSQTTNNLSVNPTVIRFLEGGAVTTEEIQLVMETSRSALGVQFAYLMDAQGIVIASTKFQDVDPITGKDFSFRPYFIDALAGHHVIYPAIGVQTMTRGLYFSSPVVDKSNVSIGVIVIKMGLESIDELLGSANTRMALTAGDGVIFSTNQTGWFLKVAGDVDSGRLQEIRDTRQFADEPLDRIPFKLDQTSTPVDGVEHHIAKVSLAAEGQDIWNLYSLQPINLDYPLSPNQVNTNRIISGVIGLLDLIILSLIFNIGKRRKSEEELRHNKENLEVIVEDRTQQLQIANQDLEARSDFIKSTFGRYISNDIVDNLLESPDQIHGEGERRSLSILMTDIRGFSTISSRLEPEQVVRLLNIYLGEMTEIILEHGGTIDEFIGDAILVLFGAPIKDENHAFNSVQCAVQMQLAMAEVNKLNKDAGLPSIEMGIGINSGEVVVGNIGSEKRLKYGVVGSAVNMTSRIESYTIGGQILISESTFEIVQDRVVIGSNQTVHPKGANEPFEIYEVLGSSQMHLLESNKIELQKIQPGIAVWYSKVVGKEMTQESMPATVIAWSNDRLQLTTEIIPQMHDNVFIKSSEANKDGYHGKVVERSEVDFTIRLSSELEDIKLLI